MTLSNLDLRGVLPVPPLARKRDAKRTLDFTENDGIVRHMTEGGITRFLYGGNAFLYHITLAEYQELLAWLSGLPRNLMVIPSAGPSFGRAMDQAALLRRHSFPCVMLLPSADPRDAEGLEAGYREFAAASGLPLVVYLKDENNFGSDRTRGIEAVGRLVDSGVCVAIKYAVIRQDPSRDAYLEMLLRRVPREVVISGIGERPAVCHMRDWKLQGFTTGSGCIAPGLSHDLHAACARGDFDTALRIRERFLPIEDLRDAWGPARVLHAATELAGLAATGEIPPYVSGLTEAQQEQLRPVAATLLRDNNSKVTAAA
jgi:dihydrodipicolinate synthase/N-acetylneuraminate lyase